MKKLTIEQKAQRYDEAIKIAKDSFNYPDYPGFIRADVVFPELKESEDERIRKELINYLDNFTNSEDRELVNMFISWLEKQGEQKPYGQRKECEDCQFNYASECKGYCALKRDDQKPSDKVEPKFNVGDWVVDEDDNRVYQIERVIENVTSGKYAYDLMGGCYFPSTKKNYHLWTIQDAKDGDVLVANIHHREIGGNIEKLQVEVPIIFIYQKVKSDNKNIHMYVSLFDNTTLNTYKNIYYIDEYSIKDICLATKEQRDLLFQKMRDAGYEWDAEKKESKKIK